jgi:photosystem II stability/assembly factor-like uncharacterized protein
MQHFQHLTSRCGIGLLFLAVSSLAFAQKKKAKVEAVPATIVQTSTATTATDRMAGYQQRQKLSAASIVNNIKFRGIGPTNMSGRVADIDVNDANPNQFFVAYASGGLWRTDNNGMSFVPLFDNESVMTIGDIAVDWTTNGQTIWVGTGESISSRSSYSGNGIYKTTNGGKTWQHIGLEESHHIGKIVLHPNNPNTAWVAALGHLYSFNKERGMYKTTDGGKTWKQTLYIDDQTGAIDVDIDLSNPSVLYASMWHRERTAWNFVEGGKSSGLYKSTDGGDSWKQINVEGSGFPTGEGNGRIGMSIYAKNSNILYAFLDNQNRRKEDVTKTPTGLTTKTLRTLSKDDFLKLSDNELNEYLDQTNFPEKHTAKKLKEQVAADKLKVSDLYQFVAGANDEMINTPVIGAEIYRSDDAGKTWKRTHDDYIDAVYTYGYVFGQVFISPDNPDRIITYGVPVLESTDAGKTWKSIDGDKVHADQHYIWFNPKNPNHIILGNDGGVYLTYDSGKNWQHLNSTPVGQFYAIGVDMEKPYNVYGGLQDNGVWWGTSQPGEELRPWKSLFGGDGMQVQVDWRDNSTVYTGSQFGFYARLNKNNTGFGNSKRLQMPATEIGEAKTRFNWQSPIVLSRHNQDIVYFGSNKFNRSLDKGETFQTLSGDLTKGSKEGDVPYGTLTTIAESPKRFGLLYVGSDDGLIHVSKDGGYSWTKISDKLPQNLWVSRVAASNHNEGTVYASLNGYRNDDFKAYLYVSTDYGQNWQTIGADLPAEPINVVQEDPKNANIIYVGTDHGVYISINKGQSFMSMNGGLPAAPVHDLLVHPRDNELVVGTHGRSIYVADVSLVQQLTDSTMTKDMVVFPLKPLNYSPTWGRMFDKYAEPRVQKYDIAYMAKTPTKATIKVLTDKGLAIRTLTDDAETGFNFVTFDLTIDATAKTDYEKYLNDVKRKDEKAITLEAADDKKIYLRAGKYKVLVETATGSKAEQTLEIKAAERRPSRRGN